MGDNKYEKGKTYQIVDVGFNKCYIGSTTETLKRRMARHKDNYMKYKNGSEKKFARSIFLFDEFGVDNCKILLIKNYPCNNREELEKEEGQEILKNLDKCVNKIVVGRTPKEYYDTNREQLLQNKKEHRINNIEQYKEKDRKYHEEHREERNAYSKEWYENNKEYAIQKRQEYREQNLDKCKQCDKNYYEKNREAIRARRSVKTQCGCGGSYVRDARAQHFRTKKHQDWLNKQNEE